MSGLAYSYTSSLLILWVGGGGGSSHSLDFFGVFRGVIRDFGLIHKLLIFVVEFHDFVIVSTGEDHVVLLTKGKSPALSIVMTSH